MFFKVSILYLFFYMLYVQFSSKIGGIWLRPNDKGQWSFTLLGLSTMIFSPFSNIRLWYPDMWDLNYFVGTSITYLFSRLSHSIISNF